MWLMIYDGFLLQGKDFVVMHDLVSGKMKNIGSIIFIWTRKLDKYDTFLLSISTCFN